MSNIYGFIMNNFFLPFIRIKRLICRQCLNCGKTAGVHYYCCGKCSWEDGTPPGEKPYDFRWFF